MNGKMIAVALAIAVLAGSNPTLAESMREAESASTAPMRPRLPLDAAPPLPAEVPQPEAAVVPLPAMAEVPPAPTPEAPDPMLTVQQPGAPPEFDVIAKK